jgi:predicted transcriptional regulator
MELTESNFSEGSKVQEVLESKINDQIDNMMTVESDAQMELIAKALSSETRRQILYYIRKNEDGMDVSNIASELNMTEANISAQVKKLKKAGLIECDYCSGHHGVRKISKLKCDSILFKI